MKDTPYVIPITSNNLSVYAAGTAYSLTATPAALDFGTTDPTITLTQPGTYLILANCLLKYNGATFAASRTITLKLRRTNNTAADVTNGSAVIDTGVVTTLTSDLQYPAWWAIYTTPNANDIVTIFGDVSVVPTAGSLDTVAASIVAFRLQQ